MPLPAFRGEPIRNKVTATWFNKVSQQLSQTQPGSPYQFKIDHIEIDFMLDEADGVSVAIAEPVVLTDHFSPPENSVVDVIKNSDIIVKCKKPAMGVEFDDDNWGVTTSNAASGFGTGNVVVAGLVWAKFERTDEDHKYVKLDTTSYTLKSTAEKTRARIISFIAFSGDAGEGLLLLCGSGGSGSATIKTFTLTADLASGIGATATATLADTTSVVIINTGLWRTFSGATGLAIEISGSYYVITVNEPGDMIATLGTDPEPEYAADPREANAVITGTPVVFTQYPHSFFKDPSTSVPNPLKLYGQSGDTVIIKWNRATDAFFIFQVIPAQQRMFWGELAADAPAGLLQDIDVNVTDPLTPGTVPTDPVTVSDLFDLAHNAKDGDRCLVIWDNNTGSYKMLECVHTTTRFLGELDADFDSTPDTFTVDHIRSYDGNDPVPATAIEVENRWDWVAGKTGKKLDILWDPTTETWYPDEIQCPDDPTPVYF